MCNGCRVCEELDWLLRSMEVEVESLIDRQTAAPARSEELMQLTNQISTTTRAICRTIDLLEHHHQEVAARSLAVQPTPITAGLKGNRKRSVA